jgi:hypothetical protein
MGTSETAVFLDASVCPAKSENGMRVEDQHEMVGETEIANSVSRYSYCHLLFVIWIVTAPCIYIPYKPLARVELHHKIIHGVWKHSRYNEVLLAGVRGFYLSLLQRVFHVKILCLLAVISFCSPLLPIAFYNTLFGHLPAKNPHFPVSTLAAAVRQICLTLWFRRLRYEIRGRALLLQ